MSEAMSDLRSRHTKDVIQKSFLRLLKEKRFDQLKVSDIVKKASINRATFYYHYIDKYDLLDRTKRSLIEDIITNINSPFQGNYVFDLDKAEKSMINLVNHIYTNAEFYQIALNTPDIESYIRQKYEKNLLVAFAMFNNVTMSFEDWSIYSSSVAGSNINIIKHWLDTGLKYAPNYVAQQLLENSKFSYSESLWVTPGKHVHP